MLFRMFLSSVFWYTHTEKYSSPPQLVTFQIRKWITRELASFYMVLWCSSHTHAVPFLLALPVLASLLLLSFLLQRWRTAGQESDWFGRTAETIKPIDFHMTKLSHLFPTVTWVGPCIPGWFLPSGPLWGSQPTGTNRPIHHVYVVPFSPL